MRVFVVGPESGDTFTRNVAHTFRGMGHEVFSDPARDAVASHSRWVIGLNEVLGRASTSWRRRRDGRSIRIAAAVRPQLNVVCTATLEPESIAAIRKASGAPIVCWYGDPVTNLPRGHVTSGEYDAVFMKDPDYARRLRDVLGIEAHHLPEACNPDWHRPVAERDGRAVLVAGTSYGYRNALVGRLIDAGCEVDVYGPRPAPWVPRKAAAAYTGIYLGPDNKAEAFGRAMACLNSFTPAESAASVNCRVFETCGCGGLLLTERRRSIEEYFEPDREYLAFSSFEECLEHLRRLERDYGAARDLRRRAAARAHAEHTYRLRLEAMLRILGLQPVDTRSS